MQRSSMTDELKARQSAKSAGTYARMFVGGRKDVSTGIIVRMD
jgi:hypothetical protein